MTPDAADAQVLARLRAHVEGSAGAYLGGPYSELYSVGFHGAARVGVVLAGPLSLQVGAAQTYFLTHDGSRPGAMTSFVGGLRFSIPLGGFVGGPFVDANAGIGLTGGLQRFVFDVGLGWELRPHPAIGVGVMARYLQIDQPNSEQVPDDANVLFAGLTATFRLPTDEALRAEQLAAGGSGRDIDFDGIPDVVDRCVEASEDRDNIQDEDGCPEADADDDLIEDVIDRCPLEAESRNQYQDEDGCPDEIPADAPTAEIVQGTVQISDTIRFATNSDAPLPESAPVLDAVIRVLTAHPEIRRLRVIGHADDVGTESYNLSLSARRAGAVARYLRERVHHQTVIQSEGRGNAEPACSDVSDECRARNRRVEFVIAQEPPAGGSAP